VAIASYPFFDPQHGPNTNVVLRASDAQKLQRARRAVEDMLQRVQVFALYLFLRRKDFLNANLINEVLTTQVNQMGSLLVVRQVRTDAVDHHHDESAIIHI
jgi:hypothetical protein